MTYVDELSNQKTLTSPHRWLNARANILMEGLDLGGKFFTANKSHRVEERAVFVPTKGINRHNARMLKRTGDHRLLIELFLVQFAAGVFLANAFERDLAFELLVKCDFNLTKATSRMMPQHLKPPKTHLTLLHCGFVRVAFSFIHIHSLHFPRGLIFVAFSLFGLIYFVIGQCCVRTMQIFKV